MKTNKLVWQAIGNAKIDNKPDNPEEFINTWVKSILAGFPPEAAKKTEICYFFKKLKLDLLIMNKSSLLYISQASYLLTSYSFIN